ncbi:MAG: CAP domain-containing protein [Drouetiella hepatica Uher 2000/2452]|jgi:uncharacterized protein YkwD|uniref:CAP domain-containing protein n=1 Tax=Drouetiella hepatica Uher 2000/2452 TaxID=904376 RepID=A0A951ULZ3_9CYAN|nr:CAP domain-containing protein [Drouetiella hepatica Uher 2000/2452]
MKIGYWLAASTSALLLSCSVQTVSSEGVAEEPIVSPAVEQPAAEQPAANPPAANPPAADPDLVAQNSGNSTTALESSILQQVNQYRKKKGLSQLSSNATITQQSRQHSQSMATSRNLSHDGFENRVSTIGKSISYRSAAENVAYNMGYSTPARQAVEGWLKSPGHLKNIEGDYNLTGIGVVKNAQGEYYFTQIFIKR